MNVDSYYEIGAGHTICEDHSIHGECDGLYYVIGADGCSSSEGVDLGAGLLCHVAKKQIVQLHRTNKLFDAPKCRVPPRAIALSDLCANMDVCEIEKRLRDLIVQNCLDLGSSLRLNTCAFDATLWIVIAYQKRILIFGWGDGAVIIKGYGTQDILVAERKYESGAPYYLSYQMDFQRNVEYHKMEGKLIETYHNETAMQRVFDVDVPFVRELDFADLPLLFPNVKSVSICSDGIKTYEQREPQLPCHILTVASDFVDYKNLVGRFVERRMLKLRKTFKEKNIVHLDDIFCATINLES